MIALSSVRDAALWEEALCLNCGETADDTAPCINCNDPRVLWAGDILAVLDAVDMEDS